MMMQSQDKGYQRDAAAEDANSAIYKMWECTSAQSPPSPEPFPCETRNLSLCLVTVFYSYHLLQKRWMPSVGFLC